MNEERCVRRGKQYEEGCVVKKGRYAEWRRGLRGGGGEQFAGKGGIQYMY